MTELMLELTKAREAMYRFLGGIYIMEVDAKQLKLLKAMDFSGADTGGNADLEEGYRLLRGYLSTADEDSLEDLAADYAKVFLAAGDAAGKAAFPYESVYTDKRHQIGGSTQMQMRALYLARGWEPDPKVYRTMEDNIGLILEYMGVLCAELKEKLAEGDLSAAGGLLAEQRELVCTHLANWVPAFAADVVRYAELDFYRAIAKLTSGFVRQELQFLGEVGPDGDIV